MRSGFPLLLFLSLALISCQQRYGHVKKVQGMEIQMPAEEAKIPEPQTDGQEESIPDLLLAEGQPDTAAVGIFRPSILQELPVRELILPKLAHPLSPVRNMVRQLPVPAQTVYEEPNEEWVIIASFLTSILVWTGIVIGFGLLVGLISIFIWFPDFVFLILLAAAIALIILGLIFSYRLGKRFIRNKLGYLPPRKKLLLFFFGVIAGLALLLLSVFIVSWFNETIALAVLGTYLFAAILVMIFFFLPVNEL